MKKEDHNNSNVVFEGGIAYIKVSKRKRIRKCMIDCRVSSLKVFCNTSIIIAPAGTGKSRLTFN